MFKILHMLLIFTYQTSTSFARDLHDHAILALHSIFSLVKMYQELFALHFLQAQ